MKNASYASLVVLYFDTTFGIFEKEKKAVNSMFCQYKDTEHTHVLTFCMCPPKAGAGKFSEGCYPDWLNN